MGDLNVLHVLTVEQLRALIETEIGNLKAGNFDPAILAAAVNNDRLQLMTMAESFTTAAEVALELSRQRIGMNEVLADLKKSETVTKDIFVQETNRILTSAPAVVYKRSGEKTDRIHAEKPPITPVQIPEAVSPYAMELAQIPSGTANGPEVIDWEMAITETPVSDTKLYSTKNERNERFVFTIEFPAGRYHDLYHALALDYLTLIGTDQKDLAAFDSELYKLALNLQVSCGNYTSGITVSGLQKYLPQAIELLAERLTQVKSDPDAFHRYVERIKKSRADAKKNPNRLFSGAISRALYGEKCPALHQLMTAELEQTDPAELTARLRDLCRTMPRNFIYYGPGDPRETASLIRKYFPEPDKNLRKIPEPVKFKIVPPAENTVCVIRHPAVQVLAGLIRPGDVQIPADTAFELLLDSYSGPLFFTELREKQALGYVAQASYSTPAIQPDNYATFMAIIGTQNDKLAQGMKAMSTMTDHLPQDLNRYRIVRENAVTSLLSQRIKPEHRYFFRQDQQRLNLPLDQAVRDLEQIRNTDGKA
ncbi:MAG: insulinase family protein, partial [Lentisphaeria bacterium]|nr:insulinase family protein [Lentisphaeria bacterium]